MATGIKDKVAIIGMGCSSFGERWDAAYEDLMVEAFIECIEDAGIEKNDIQAAWQGMVENCRTGRALATALRLPNIPVTRVENACATGTDAFRGACYAVASGAYDICLAMGAEKVKDSGYGGLNVAKTPSRIEGMIEPNITAPGSFAQLAIAYSAKYNVDMDDLKRAMAHVSWKSHQNGSRNPKAHLQKTVSMEEILNAPMVAYPLGLYDCCGVSDGAACAIVTTPEIAKDLGKKNPVRVKAIQLSVSNGYEYAFNEWDGSYTVTTDRCAEKAYIEAGIQDPRKEISMMEVHDCFSITELVVMEDLKVSARGHAWEDILSGFFDADGELPCQMDGGLKCFGHPIGASGLRMIYELYLQFLGRAGARQIEKPRLGLTHNLGGHPFWNVVAVSIIGM